MHDEHHRTLTCWKDIAKFFGKGVRTVQRWEALGMPVHRPNGDRSMVFADPQELKAWSLRRKSRNDDLLERCRSLLAESKVTAQRTEWLIAESKKVIAKLNTLAPTPSLSKQRAVS